jgi:hypothetical protein
MPPRLSEVQPDYAVIMGKKNRSERMGNESATLSIEQ